MVNPTSPLDRLRIAMITRTVSLFAHAGDPTEHTLAPRGDPGLFGPRPLHCGFVGVASGFTAGYPGARGRPAWGPAIRGGCWALRAAACGRACCA